MTADSKTAALGWVVKLPGGRPAQWTFAPLKREAVAKARANLPSGGWRQAVAEGCQVVRAVKAPDGSVEVRL